MGCTRSGGAERKEMLLQNGAVSEKKEKNGKQYTNCLSRWKWREGAILVCLVIAYMACNVAYSMIVPFFPGEARNCSN
jgi:hypothetical protein